MRTYFLDRATFNAVIERYKLELRRGVMGDPEGWMTSTGIAPR